MDEMKVLLLGVIGMMFVVSGCSEKTEVLKVEEDAKVEVQEFVKKEPVKVKKIKSLTEIIIKNDQPVKLPAHIVKLPPKEEEVHKIEEEVESIAKSDLIEADPFFRCEDKGLVGEDMCEFCEEISGAICSKFGQTDGGQDCFTCVKS